jgi:hypothetical protein
MSGRSRVLHARSARRLSAAGRRDRCNVDHAFGWQQHREDGAAAKLAFDADARADEVGQLARDGKAETPSSVQLSERHVEPRELVEDALDFVVRNADPGVANAYCNCADVGNGGADGQAAVQANSIAFVTRLVVSDRA